MEATLKKHFHTPFMITSAPDAKFGEIVVLLIENNPGSRDTYERIQKICEDVLPAYWCPKTRYTGRESTSYRNRQAR